MRRLYITPKVTRAKTLIITVFKLTQNDLITIWKFLKGETILSKVAKQVGLESYEKFKDKLTITNQRIRIDFCQCETTD